MKFIYKLFLLLTLYIAANSSASAQCKADDCVAKVTGGYTFLKSYQVDKTADQAEYSYVFSKDTDYMLSLCNKDGSQTTIVNVYDTNKKEIASNFDKKSGKFYPAIVYGCHTTGIYYIKFTFNVKPDCFSSVLAFKK